MQLIHEVRAVKNKKEIANIIRAQRISEEVLWDVLKFLRTGKTEKEVQNFIVKSFKKYSTPILSFTPIVAFGKGSADIHHEPGKTKLKVGDIIMFDFGTTVNHYCSDMTRTFFWGGPTKRQKKVYQDVLRAQEIAIRKIAKGERRAKAIDSAARKYLAKNIEIILNMALGMGSGLSFTSGRISNQ